MKIRASGTLAVLTCCIAAVAALPNADECATAYMMGPELASCFTCELVNMYCKDPMSRAEVLEANDAGVSGGFMDAGTNDGFSANEGAVNDGFVSNGDFGEGGAQPEAPPNCTQVIFDTVVFKTPLCGTFQTLDSVLTRTQRGHEYPLRRCREVDLRCVVCTFVLGGFRFVSSIWNRMCEKAGNKQSG